MSPTSGTITTTDPSENLIIGHMDWGLLYYLFLCSGKATWYDADQARDEAMCHLP